MSRQVYEIALGIFLLQSVLIPVLLIATGIVWYRQVSRLNAMERALDRDRRRQAKGLDALLESLPKLDPLQCDGCGSPVALEARSARCISCEARSELPADYRATIALRRALERISAAAIRDWRIAKLLTSLPARWLFRLMIVAEPLLFVLVLIGAATFDDTIFDRFFVWLPNELETALMTLAICGFILWTIVFIFLASLARSLRDKVPAYPEVRRGEFGAAEYASCHACGGGIAFRPGSFAALCPYCAVATFRAAFARGERARSEERQVLTRATLFGALEIIEDFTGMFVVVMTILSLGFAVLIAVAAFNT